MKLNITQVREIAKGAVRVTEEKDGFHFYRFTKEQEELYNNTNKDFYQKTFATAGIRLTFKTDSRTLFLKTVTSKGSSRTYFSFDIFADGKPVGYLDNFSGVELPEKYPEAKLPQGAFEKTFSLGEGEKTVCVYFPWSVQSVVEEISIDDGAYIEPVKTEKKMLTFGDSITHGYDALRPSMRYAARLADALGAEEVNKAIGGECFFPELAATKEDFQPEYITVAYGTNDWSRKSAEEFRTNCRAFYTALSENYPEAKIYAFTPIWRKDLNVEKKFGKFEDVEKYIRECVEGLKNVMVISGFDLVPEDEMYFADRSLHPNDEGFDFYFKNLYKKLK